MYKVSIQTQGTYCKTFGPLLVCRLSCFYNLPPAQVQVLSAALKAAQLDSPSDNSPTEPQPELQPENNTDSPSAECNSVEVQSQSEETFLEEELKMETPPASETNPLQEQGDEETQTEPLGDQEDSPINSPVVVRDTFLTLKSI